MMIVPPSFFKVESLGAIHLLISIQAVYVQLNPVFK